MNTRMKRKSIINIFIILLSIQGIFCIFLINQNNSIEKLTYEKVEVLKKGNLTIEKLKLNSELNLNNNFSIYENTKQWINYSKNRINLELYKDKNQFEPPLTEIGR
jgi:hypothetical protein